MADSSEQTRRTMRRQLPAQIYNNTRDRMKVWVTVTPRRRLASRVTFDIVEVGLADSAMTLAAQAFTSLLPVMIAASTLQRLQPLSDAARDNLGVELPSADVSTGSATAFGIVGLLMLLISSTSYARALGRMYGRIWHVPIATLRQAWRWLAVVFVIAGSVAIAAVCHKLDSIPAVGRLLGFAAVYGVWALVWTLVPMLLTANRMTTRMCIGSGLLTATGLSALHVASTLFLPRITRTSQDQFGLLGVMFTLISWLFVFSAIVVVAGTIVGSVAKDDGPLGSWLRRS
ncbi:hypothetical protein [Rhodococcus sp. KBS0724]|uniref:hypothetical protein n=1 Tax=Rhodococcus sp. KBS0724 TaxID=1179674 RepID=UPI0021B0CEC0|nr:hypothetical protein [Rhodococcus sp. KBS0724]